MYFVDFHLLTQSKEIIKKSEHDYDGDWDASRR